MSTNQMPSENRRRCESSSPGCRSSRVGAERSPTRETPGRVGSSADKAGTAGHCQIGRVRRARSDGVREEPVSKLRKRGTGSNLVDMGRDAVHGRPMWTFDSVAGLACWWGGHREGLRRRRGDAAGAKLDAKLIDRFAVNTGTCGCPKLASGNAACVYSWIRPPSRSRRRTLTLSEAAGWGSGRRGAA
jgi:hypothetical protein